VFNGDPTRASKETGVDRIIAERSRSVQGGRSYPSRMVGVEIVKALEGCKVESISREKGMG
jgi:hypothetical protein